MIDREPHAWGERERRIVEDLAAAVATDIELRVRGVRQEEIALTDGLTGLANRRAMAMALNEQLAGARPAHVAVFDLDGFKAYNDAFGHPAGDDLLIRLSARLRAAVGERGRAFRMGGDEFCVLVDDPALLVGCQAALADQGPGFQITASMGQVRLPDEAADATATIGLADSRLYEAKRSRPGSVHDQLAAALAVTLAEREGGAVVHLDAMSRLVRDVAVSLGVEQATLRRLAIASRLHDIGKMAISDAILRKPGPLEPQEWEVVHRHPMIGERILTAAPALAGAAGVVRSSHERWDGDGYPDRLTGEEIPLGSRIISACDAFMAMTAERPYRPARSTREALDELERCAAGQFDPRVVEALLQVVEPALHSPPALAPRRRER